MPLLGADGQAPIHLLGQLIGLDYSASPHLAAMDPRQLRDRAHAAFVALLQALAANTAAGAAAGRRPALGRRRLAGPCSN
jgi:hypothetical protein